MLLIWKLSSLGRDLVALIGSDVQEVIWSGIAIRILSNGLVPPLGWSCHYNFRLSYFSLPWELWCEEIGSIFLLITVMALSFAWIFGEAKPNGLDVLVGILVPKLSSRTIQQAVEVVGCIIMPYNVFLHSALISSGGTSACLMHLCHYKCVVN